MKRIFSTFSLFAIIAFASTFTSAKAENVDLLKAKQTGAYYLSQMKGTKSANVNDIKLALQLDNKTLAVPALYVLNVPEQGYVVVSGSDCVEPVLAYSTTDTMDANNIPPACQWMLDSYAKYISNIQNNEIAASNEVRGLWKSIEEETFRANPSKYNVLLDEKWGQGEVDRPSYNIFCPRMNADGSYNPSGIYYSYVGCVATAMAQIIHYYKFPVVGGTPQYNTASYNWNGNILKYKFAVDSNKFIYDSMPNRIYYTDPYSKKHQIAKLSYACGVTVRMGYGLDGSGTQSSYVPDAFIRYFGYSDKCRQVIRQHYNDNDWLTLIREELNNGRPIYYSGYSLTGEGRDRAGHAFVLCGINTQTSKKFYVNWGWDGGSDGWYTFAPASSVETAGGYTFTEGHAMVIGIQPKNESIAENTQMIEEYAYPNPASSYIMIPANNRMNQMLIVYSLDGRMVEKTTVPAGTNTFRLDLQHYTSGSYFYRFNGKAVKFEVVK